MSRVSKQEPLVMYCSLMPRTGNSILYCSLMPQVQSIGRQMKGTKLCRCQIPRGKCLGIKYPGVKCLGVKCPGVKCPGVNCLGVKCPGVNCLGVKCPGVKCPGVKSPGVKGLGIKRSGVITLLMMYTNGDANSISLLQMQTVSHCCH